MHRFLISLLSAASVFVAVSSAQGTNTLNAASSSRVEPLRIPSGTILAFHLQTRLHPTAEDPLDALPQGTILHVKILRPIDSTVDRDGSEFHGWVVSDLSLGDGVVIHADSQVRGLLVLLRSRAHPDGFRYELLLTELTDHGNSYPLTASLGNSFVDAGAHPVTTATAAPKDSSKQNSANKVKTTSDSHP
jgi:hypothetical protein